MQTCYEDTLNPLLLMLLVCFNKNPKPPYINHFLDEMGSIDRSHSSPNNSLVKFYYLKVLFISWKISLVILSWCSQSAYRSRPLGGLQSCFELSEELIRKLQERHVFLLVDAYDRDMKDIWILGWKSDIDLRLGGIYTVEWNNYRKWEGIQCI
jgi:hypothetical protein